MHDGSVIHEASAENYVVPADGKENARLIISEIILDIFNGLKWLTQVRGAPHWICNRLVKSNLILTKTLGSAKCSVSAALIEYEQIATSFLEHCCDRDAAAIANDGTRADD